MVDKLIGSSLAATGALSGNAATAALGGALIGLDSQQNPNPFGNNGDLASKIAKYKPQTVDQARQRPLEEEVKYGQQERILPRGVRQRYRPESESLMDQIFFQAESGVRNNPSGLVEQQAHDAANEQARNQLLNQAAEPLEEEQKQSREDANEIAGQIAGAINAQNDAEQIANEIVQAIENNDWDEDEVHNILAPVIDDLSSSDIKKIIAITGVLGLAHGVWGTNKEGNPITDLTPQQEKQMEEYERDAPDVDKRCRRYLTFRNGKLHSTVICDYNRKVYLEQ